MRALRALEVTAMSASSRAAAAQQRAQRVAVAICGQHFRERTQHDAARIGRAAIVATSMRCGLAQHRDALRVGGRGGLAARAGFDADPPPREYSRSRVRNAARARQCRAPVGLAARAACATPRWRARCRVRAAMVVSDQRALRDARASRGRSASRNSSKRREYSSA